MCNTLPIWPARMRLIISTNEGWKRRLNPTPSVTPAALHASIAFSALLRGRVIGFLAEAGLAGFGSLDDLLHVQRVRRRQHHRVDLGILQHAAVGRDDLDPGLLRKLLVL